MKITGCKNVHMVFPFYRRGKSLSVNFKGGEISSDSGTLFLRQLDDKLKLTEMIARAIDDNRDPRYITHDMQTLIRQRVYQIATGYEDCNDADDLRSDPILKISCDRQLDESEDLGSQPTFSRLENSLRWSELYRTSEIFVERFIRRHHRPPKKIILDMDSTDDPTHGAQQLSMFNGYYDQHMYHPLLIFEGTSGDLLAPVLRPGNVNSSPGSVAILRRIVKRLRSEWPNIRITVRADGGFAIPDLYEFCEEEHLDYVIGFQGTAPLKLLNEKNLQSAREEYKQTKMKVRIFDSTDYCASSWNKKRRVIMKTEVSVEGENQRFVVTNLTESAEEVYDFYAMRGEVENQMIKELKLDTMADRLSCHRFAANQFRLLLHGFAYTLLLELRRKLHGTELATARMATLRLRLLRVAARVRQTFRRIWIELPSSYPFKEIWYTLFTRLCPAC